MFVFSSIFAACKQKDLEVPKSHDRVPKKPRLVFTDIQRRTLHAIFKETQRPSKEMQITISKQLGLELSTVANFFMNARRRYHKFAGGEIMDDTASLCDEMGETPPHCPSGLQTPHLIKSENAM